MLIVRCGGVMFFYHGKISSLVLTWIDRWTTTKIQSTAARWNEFAHHDVIMKNTAHADDENLTAHNSDCAGILFEDPSKRLQQIRLLSHGEAETPGSNLGWERVERTTNNQISPRSQPESTEQEGRSRQRKLTLLPRCAAKQSRRAYIAAILKLSETRGFKFRNERSRGDFPTPHGAHQTRYRAFSRRSTWKYKCFLAGSLRRTSLLQAQWASSISAGIFQRLFANLAQRASA